MKYDFSQLTDKEFEQLGIELVAVFLRKRIERFKSGKDFGVDGRFFSNNNIEIILQVKHYLKSGFSSLISTIKNKEFEKVNKISPERYIFITSLELSRKNKQQIKELFAPYVLREDDIFGQEDLNDILSSNSKIEEKYFKLWISSTNVFDRIINNAIKGRSEFELEQIKLKSKYYVQTKFHEEAIIKLKENNVLIISGEPGIGKTTLAENLCLYFASKNYEFCDIEESISEAENIFHREKKQIFYFDDFLGSNYFEAIENKKDSHIVKFIDRIKNDKSKIFILTSRTNILSSGIAYSSIFYNKNISKNEYLISVKNISQFDKARILYNHIWFSKLDQEFLNELYKDKRYRKIIDHQNFNPRIIEFITDEDRVSPNITNYWNYVWETLENPIEIWSNQFKVQSNEFIRNIVLLTVFNGSRIKDIELKDSYNYLIELEGQKYSTNTSKDFKFVSKLATKSFLNREIINGEVYYDLFNPSIADFVLNEYSNNRSKLTNIFLSLCTTKSIDNLKDLIEQNLISKDIGNSIKTALIEDEDLKDKIDDYILLVLYEFKNVQEKKELIVSYLDLFSEFPRTIKNITLLLAMLFFFKKHIKNLDSIFFQFVVDNYHLDENSLKLIMDFIKYYKIEDEDLFESLKDASESFFEEILNEFHSEVEVSNYIVYYSDEYGNEDTEYDYDGVHDNINDRLIEKISEFNEDVINKMGIDAEDFSNQIDAEKVFAEFMSNYEPDVSDFNHSYSYSTPDVSIDPIDDLFERT